MKPLAGSQKSLSDAHSPSPVSERNVHAQRLFDGIAHSYDMPANLFSLFQYTRWHRFLVSHLGLNSRALALDVATGPAGVAIQMSRTAGCPVVGVDISSHMLQQAESNLKEAQLTSSVSLVRARAEDLPFPDQTFDAVVFTYLLRYVDDPVATVRELARVLKPGGRIASLDFFVPKGPLLYPLWLAHTRLVLPLGTRLLAPGWKEVGAFLGPNISAFYRKNSLEDLRRMWVEAGMDDVQTRTLSQGGALVMWGTKNA